MLAPNRRRERNRQAISMISGACNSSITLDISGHEMENRFLEGTGSIIFDHGALQAYASLSPRTDKGLFEDICQQLNYQPHSFTCKDQFGQDFYHTNVILHIGQGYAVIYEQGIADEKEKKNIIGALSETKQDIISISMEQVTAFCGNLLQVRNKKGDVYLLCSERALKAFTAEQIKILERYSEIIPFQIPVIEDIGGGSIRCMIAELF
jgi:hypothetical protein